MNINPRPCRHWNGSGILVLTLNCLALFLASGTTPSVAQSRTDLSRGPAASALSVEKTVDQETELEGELEILYEDSKNGSRLQYYLKTRDERLSLHFADQAPSLLTGSKVRVKGIRVGQSLVLASGSTQIGTKSSRDMQTTAALLNTMGQHNVLVILVNFQDKTTQPVSADSVRNTLFGSTSNFYREMSYGQTWLTGDVYGWFTLPVSYTTCDTAAIASYAQQAATAAGANLSGYNHYIYAFPANACLWSGRASVGGNPSQAWINDSFDLGVVGHELGHNFGLFHSRSMDCDNVVTGSNCTIAEYGDTLDVMGSASSGHFNLYQKERLSWTNYGSSPPITTVTTSGTYWIDSYESISANPKGLKILKFTDPTTGARTWYYLEHRSAYGFDAFLGSNTNVLNGLVVHQGSESSSQSIYLLDMTPATTSWMDPALTTGQSFSDADAAVTITVLSADSTGALVSVSLGTQQQCTGANPSVTLSPSQGPLIAAGTDVNYTVSVTNNDSAICGAATFDFQASVPAGWTAFAPSSLTINPGASATTTLGVTSSATAAGGTYSISATARNSSNTLYSGTASGTYSVISEPPPPSPPSIVLSSKASYSRSQTATVTASVSAAGSPVVGASVAFTMTKSNGSIVTGSGVTGSNGTATFKYSFNRKSDPAGTYQVVGTTSVNGVLVSGTTSFAVK